VAFTPIVPGTINVQAVQALAQEFQSTAVNNFSGSPVDLSAWTSLTAKIQALNPSPNTSDVTFGTVTANSSGIVTLLVDSTDLATVPVGSANLIISGKPTSGDHAQTLATGILTLVAG